MLKKVSKIIISRTDAIGDVILTLPMAGILKKQIPEVEIIFLGKDYTEHIIKNSKFVDKFISWDNIKNLNTKEQIAIFKELNADLIIHVFPNKQIAKIAKKAQIKYRIGTSHRIYHWHTCNKLLNLGRKNSNLHEAQLNINLLQHLDIQKDFPLSKLPYYYGFTKNKKLPDNLYSLLDKSKFNLILHPKSHGSGREWGIGNFTDLVNLLDPNKYKIFITGTDKEKKEIGDLLQHPKITDLTGKLNLQEFIAFISNINGLVASGTGPLHIAAAFGKKAIGIYPPIKPIDPQRWAPIGENAHFLVINKTCTDCKNGAFCHCMQEITAQEVIRKLEIK